MAYSREIYEKALSEIKYRRVTAEREADERKIELYAKCPDLKYIDEKLSETGKAIVAAFSAPPEDAEKIFEKIKKENLALNNEKTAILRALGLPADYLQVHYTCKICGDTGFTEERDDEKGVSYGTRLCRCHIDLLKKYAADEMATKTPLELSSFDDFDLALYKGDKEALEQMTYIFNSCVSYAKNFDLDSTDLLFHGRTGLGKTHLSLSIANEVIKKGYNVVYGSAPEFFSQIEREKFGKGNETYTLDRMTEADLLILDDLGMEFVTSFTSSALYTVINTRICKGLPTVISTNLSVEELREKYHESIVSRIVGNFEALEFLGKDVRQLN